MAFTNDEVEDGTGKTTAIVYEQVAVAAAWLQRRGLSSFADLDELQQEAVMLRAVGIAEDEFGGAFHGVPITEGQGLLWPAAGAIDWNSNLLSDSTVPRAYLEGIRLLCEHVADGSYDQTIATTGIVEEQHGTKRVRYAEAGRSSSMAQLFPLTWRNFAKILPPGN